MPQNPQVTRLCCVVACNRLSMQQAEPLRRGVACLPFIYFWYFHVLIDWHISCWAFWYLCWFDIAILLIWYRYLVDLILLSCWFDIAILLIWYCYLVDLISLSCWFDIAILLIWYCYLVDLISLSCWFDIAILLIWYCYLVDLNLWHSACLNSRLLLISTDITVKSFLSKMKKSCYLWGTVL